MSRIEKALEEAVRLRAPVPGGEGPEAPASGVVSEEGAAFVPKNPYFVTLTEPASPVSEEYRKLKSMVLRLTKKDVFRNMLMVTSALSGEGKSITSLNLAAILAQDYNHTVLLVDADMRRPSLHTFLEIVPKDGLSDCLGGRISIDAAVVRTGIPKLSFLASGTAAKNPVELLSSLQMKKLLAELKQRYRDRYIIIDTPPLLPFAETHAMSGMVDGVLFVVKEEATPMKSIREALDLLAEAPVLGIIYNDVSAEGLSNRYRDYVYSRYSYEQHASAG